MQRLFLTILIITVCLTSGGGRAKAQDPTDEILRLVNAARAELGVAPLHRNATLDAAAQAFTEWRTQANLITHTGADGSTPQSRARAAGYTRTYVGENIVEGGLMTPEAAVRWWRGSSVHYRNMISTNYQDVGIGYTITADGYKRYTLLLGGGGTISPPAASGNGSTAPEPEPEEAVAYIAPVEIATPRPEDGAVIHIVQEGQALWTIATVYGVDLNELLEINGLYEGAYIHPGNEIIIDPGNMPPRPKAPLIHVVQAKESLWSIAAMHHISLDELIALNGLEADSIIYAGDELIIRPGSPTETPIPSETPPPPPTEASTAVGLPTPHPVTPTASNSSSAPTPHPLTGGGAIQDGDDADTAEQKGPDLALAAGVGLLVCAGVTALLGVMLERRRRR